MPLSIFRCYPCLAIALGSLIFFAGCFADTRPKQKLIFKAAPFPDARDTHIDLETVKAIVTHRLGGAGLKSRFTVETSGKNELTVTVRGADQATLDKIGQYVTDWGRLEFAEIARPDENAELLALAEDAEREVKVDGEVRAAWLPVRKDVNGQVRQGFEAHPDVVSRQREVDGKSVTEWLVLYDPEGRINGGMLKSATASYDDAGGPAILFTLTDHGSANMSVLTTDLRPRGATYHRLGIIWNGELYSAPTVQSPISSRGQITGFTRDEVERTVQVLRSGTLPCELTFDRLVDEGEGKK